MGRKYGSRSLFYCNIEIVQSRRKDVKRAVRSAETSALAALEAFPFLVEMGVRFLTDILVTFRVGIQPLRIRIRSQPQIGVVRRPSTPVVSGG